MSMQMCVLSDTQLESTAEWQQAIDAESLPLRLCYEKPLTQAAGFLPAYLGDKLTGFECRHREIEEIIETYPEIDFGHSWKYAMALIWGGDLDQMQAAMIAAAAYARATAGVVFDEAAGEILTPPQAVQAVRDIARDMPKVEAILRDLKLG